jgi:hypothetical protein
MLNFFPVFRALFVFGSFIGKMEILKSWKRSMFSYFNISQQATSHSINLLHCTAQCNKLECLSIKDYSFIADCNLSLLFALLSLVFLWVLQFPLNLWKIINHKQSARWQHASYLKPSAFCSWLRKLWSLKMQQLILGNGATILWVTKPDS